MHQTVPVSPLAAIAAQMRANIDRAKTTGTVTLPTIEAPIIENGIVEYFCTTCGEILLKNSRTLLWESEEDLDLCPKPPAGKLRGVHHIAHKRIKPE